MSAEDEPPHVGASAEGEAEDDETADPTNGEPPNQAESPARQAKKNEQDALDSGDELPG